MQIQNIQTNMTNNITFGINISENLVSKARNSFSQHPNKPGMVFAFNKTVEKYLNRFGYDNYTIDLEQNVFGGVRKYTLAAVRNDGRGLNRIIITRQNAFKDIINWFLTTNKQEFENIMEQGQKLKKNLNY